MATEQANRYLLRNRYVLKGRMVLQTALHIGGGRVTLSSSDSPVVLTPEEIPFIPGSSFKGSLRSTVEKFVPTLSTEMFSCALIELAGEDLQEARAREERICSTARQKEIAERRRGKSPEEVEAILEQARDNLCDTCRLFGSPFAAARIAVNDLYIREGEWDGALQVRDGVAIDRDSEKAKDRLKYDFEVVPASTAFELEITLENATPQDLQLLSIGLSEFVHGFAPLGGKRSRGLGACRLEDLHVFTLELLGKDSNTGKDVDARTRDQRLRNYLLGRDISQKFPPPEDGLAFLDRHIALLFKKG